MKSRFLVVSLLVVCVAVGCGRKESVESIGDAAKYGPGTFGSDLEFMKANTEVVLLSDPAGQGMVAVSPALQGRVMTSTAGGMEGLSFGWINRELLASGKTLEHFNPFGGEDRFWIGPEGGQFSVFFKQGDPFDLDHWYTPAPFDTESFSVARSEPSRVVFEKDMELVNYSGTKFNLKVEREVQLLNRETAIKALGVRPAESVKMVAFESGNKIVNTGTDPWKPETGLLSIWILGMFNPSDGMVAVVPFREGPEDKLGPIVNDTYFGKVPADRLVIGKGVLFFSHDGKYRSKIGLSPLRAKEILGSYDSINGVLNIVQYSKPALPLGYVNSMWELQDKPYGGDVVNSYNDGPPEPGKKPLGPFCELETSSPAAQLAPGEQIYHLHRTYHLQGSEQDLEPIAKALLGVSLAEVKAVFAAK